jgi:hypothetical protein
VELLNLIEIAVTEQPSRHWIMIKISISTMTIPQTFKLYSLLALGKKQYLINFIMLVKKKKIPGQPAKLKL